jgi:hypothetical protein
LLWVLHWPADNFIVSYLPHKYHLSMQIDSPANAASGLHEAAQQLQQQQQQSATVESSKAVHRGSSRSSSNGSSNGVKSKPLENETWWRMYCAGDVLACHLATAMEQGLNLQVGDSADSWVWRAWVGLAECSAAVHWSRCRIHPAHFIWKLVTVSEPCDGGELTSLAQEVVVGVLHALMVRVCVLSLTCCGLL